MFRRNLVLLLVALVSASVFAVPLMYRAQTVISVPQGAEDIALYGLSYKANAFEAKLVSVKLETTGAPDADPVKGKWTFHGSNNDGQMHKVEIWLRLLDESGKQLAMTSGKCTLPPGAHDQPCPIDSEIKAETWKSVKSVRIVADFLS